MPFLRSLGNARWVAVVLLVALWVFLVAMGALSPGQAVGLTIVMGVLLVLAIAQTVWARRGDRREAYRAEARMRERRGF